ncbi:hypothetical protein J6590_092997 [Homalodisca vitripennis]|nr:hypothetical protein J6590_085939 [Homalodisca vitripennis]KAG8304461.1 hypothetical protein J6590_092997 [Homalodisca vitripennis]
MQDRKSFLSPQWCSQPDQSLSPSPRLLGPRHLLSQSSLLCSHLSPVLELPVVAFVLEPALSDHVESKLAKYDEETEDLANRYWDLVPAGTRKQILSSSSGQPTVE